MVMKNKGATRPQMVSVADMWDWYGRYAPDEAKAADAAVVGGGRGVPNLDNSNPSQGLRPQAHDAP